LILKICPETSVANYESKLRIMREDQGPHLHWGGSLKSRVFF